MEKKSLTFSDRVNATPGGEHLRMCYACGTCVSRCMVQERLEPAYNPRRLIKKAALDLESGDTFTDPTVASVLFCNDLPVPPTPTPPDGVIPEPGSGLLLLGLVLRDAVGLLDLARQLIVLSGNHVEVIVGEFAPLCFHLALELLPVALDDIPVHNKPPPFGT